MRQGQSMMHFLDQFDWSNYLASSFLDRHLSRNRQVRRRLAGAPIKCSHPNHQSKGTFVKANSRPEPIPDGYYLHTPGHQSPRVTPLFMHQSRCSISILHQSASRLCHNWCAATFIHTCPTKASPPVPFVFLTFVQCLSFITHLAHTLTTILTLSHTYSTLLPYLYKNAILQESCFAGRDCHRSCRCSTRCSRLPE